MYNILRQETKGSQMISKNPVYNLNAVLREVNLSPDVLRAWERRYQLPVPQRSPGGHRLYSQYDIETIKWLQARQKEGLSISHAVILWREIASTSDPLEKVSTPPVSSLPAEPVAAMPIENFRESWVNACMEYDSAGAVNVLNQAFSIFPLETVCTEVIQKGLRIFGEKWYEGTAIVQQEHFATAQAHNRIQAMIAATPRPVFDQTILIGCPPGELHTFPALLLNLFLRREGFNVVYLGADIPAEQLLETVDQAKADLVILTAQRLPSVKQLKKISLLLQSRNHPVAYGGLIFTINPSLINKIAGYYLGDSLENSISKVKELLRNPETQPVPSETSKELVVLADEFDEHRGLIEHRVTHLLKDQGFEFPNLPETNAFLGDDISASLVLGDMDLINQEITWVQNLKRKHYDPKVILGYLEAYRRATSEELGHISSPIMDWILRISLFIKESYEK
jgi:DNA-binding transcriptional MerR regulator/methanogenic corrinoid protein MtbC1